MRVTRRTGRKRDRCCGAGSAERWAGPCSGCCSKARTGHATQPSAGDRRRGALSAPDGGGLARSGQVCNPRPRRPGQYSLTAWRDCTALPVAGDRGRWSTQRGDGDAVGRDLGVERAGAVLRSWRPSAVKAQASGHYPPLHCETSKTRAGDAIGAQRSESHLEVGS